MIYSDLKNKQLESGAYHLVGDSYLIKQAIAEIATMHGVEKINIAEFNDENFDARAIFNACNQFSFFNEKRIVVVSEPAKELVGADKNLILSYLKNPNKDCLLLFVGNGTFFDFAGAEKIECKASDAFVLDFVKNQVAKLGGEIEKDAVVKLISHCLGDLNRICLEIKKLCDYTQNKTVITAKMVEEMVAKDTELKVFDLTTNMSQKNVERAHKVLFDMLRAGEPPIKILGLISGHFRRMFFAKINKGTNAELAKALGCKEYAIVKAKEQASNFSAKELKEVQNLLLEADYDIKSGLMNQENTLYYVLMKICLI